MMASLVGFLTKFLLGRKYGDGQARPSLFSQRKRDLGNAIWSRATFICIFRKLDGALENSVKEALDISGAKKIKEI